MTTETILTDEEIITIGRQARAIEPEGNGYILPVTFARAIEQAVLQSPEVQALRKDAERYKYIRLKVSASNVNHLGRPMRQFHFDRLPDPLNNPLKGSVAGHLDDAIDAAMEQQK